MELAREERREVGDCGILDVVVEILGHVEFVVQGDFAGVEGEGVVDEGHFFFFFWVWGWDGFFVLGWVCEKREREIERWRGC